MMELDIAHESNVVQNKYSNDPNFKGKPLSLKFCKKNVHAQDIAFLHALIKDTRNHLTNLFFKNKVLIKQ